VTVTRDGDGIACRPQGPGRSPAERRVGGTPVGRLRGEGGRSCGRRRWKKAKLIWTRLLITKPTPAVPSAPIDGQRAEHLLRSHHNLRSDWAGAHACHRYEASGLTSRMALPLIRCACTVSAASARFEPGSRHSFVACSRPLLEISGAYSPGLELSPFLAPVPFRCLLGVRCGASSHGAGVWSHRIAGAGFEPATFGL